MAALTGGLSRIVQVHPTRLCNLRCRHCYSESGPKERGELSPTLLRGALEDAVAEGYNVVSLSGGEPLLYSGLREVLEAAGALGLVRTLTTNGTLLDESRVAALSELVDLLAVSIDGAPERHDRMRNDPTAFQRLRRGVARLREARVPFGMIFTLTRETLPDLAWVARFASDEGATLLQIHPLESAGRAAAELAGEEPDDACAALAWVVAERLRHVHGAALPIKIDLVDTDVLRRSRGRLEQMDAADVLHGPISELASPLVVEADGTVVPLQYGFPRRFALGSLTRAPLASLFADWRSRGVASFRSFVQSALLAHATERELPIVNLYGNLTRDARAAERADAG